MRRFGAHRFAVLALAIGLGGLSFAAPPEVPSRLVKGYSWGWPGHRGEYLGRAPERSMRELAATGTQWIALSFAAHVWNKNSTEILYGDANGSMVSDSEIRRAVALARQRGLKIMLKPMICSHDGTWRAQIQFEIEADWDQWWKNYEAFLLHYAKIAADAKCEMLCVGCEMRSMERFADRWRGLIATIRKTYRGPIVYDVNHDDVEKVAWFDAVDVIGVSAYYPVATREDTSLERMLAGWKPICEQLGRISRRWNRPILFAEIGVCSAKTLSATPWASNDARLPYDGDEQARFYEAAFRSVAEEPWFLGFFWWDWKSHLYDRKKAIGRTDFCIYGKPAEHVLRKWYGRPASAPPMSYLRAEDGRFVDAEGREVLLHGMNVISKSKRESYLSWHRREDFSKMRAWGMNCVRLGVLWDGVEPEPGKYDDAYLDGVAQRVAWAGEHGLYVVLDMHQDLFSALYGDGAPAWATLDENKPHRKVAIWSDAYLLSPAVQTAFDNFWANAPASDGMGIQDHYASAWQHVAKRFADNTIVIGYDLMNEPFEGSSVKGIRSDLFRGDLGTRLAGRLGQLAVSPDRIADLWKKPGGRGALTALLDDPELFRAFVDAQAASSQAFERQRLQPMYARVAAAIREVDRNHILFLEPSYRCNIGVASALEPLTGPDGKRDARQAYAPHAYDIVVDTPALAKASFQRVEMIFDRHAAAAKRLGMPMFIGEWGALGTADERVLPSARVVQRRLETLLCSDTYWECERGIENRAYFGVLRRSLPVRVAGVLLEYASHPETGEFICRWREKKKVHAPTILYLTAVSYKDRSIRLEPQGAGFRAEAASDGSGDVYLTIPPTGESVERWLTTR